MNLKSIFIQIVLAAKVAQKSCELRNPLQVEAHLYAIERLVKEARDIFDEYSKQNKEIKS